MTEVFVIAAQAPQDHLSGRRIGYTEYQAGGLFAYVREDGQFVTRWDGDRVQMSEVFIADVRSVAVDPKGMAFYVRLQRREPVRDAILRGIALPVGGDGDWLEIDVSRRLAKDW